MFDIPSLAHKHTNNGDKRQTPQQSFYTLSDDYDHMIDVSTDIVHKVHNPTQNMVCATVILGLSQRTYDWTIRVSCRSKSLSWLRRAILHVINANCKCHTAMPLTISVSLSITEYDYMPGHTMIMSLMSQTACYFYLSTKGFSARLAQTGFFSSQRFYSFCKPTDSPIMGASDIGQVSTYIF